MPDEIVAIVEQMMAKDPAKRYQTPAEVMAALAPWIADADPAAAGPRDAERLARRRRERAPRRRWSVAYRGNGPGDSPTVIAPEPGPVVTPMPLNPLDVNTPSPVVWETLDADTQTLARGDTDRPAHERPPRLPRPSQPLRGTPPPAAPTERKRLWIFVAAGVGFLVLIVGTYLAFFNRGPKPSGTGGPTGNSHRIVVSHAGGENTVATLRDALSKAGPGDTIVIAERK